MMARDWRLALLALYAIAQGVMMLDARDSEMSGWLLLALPFWLFAILPLAPLCFWRGLALVKGLGMLVIGGGGLLLVYETMYILPPDAQGALVFVVVPVMQIAAVAVFALAVFGGQRIAGAAAQREGM